MRLVCLLVLAAMLLGCAAYAETYYEDLYPAPDGTIGANQFALRAVPLDPTPETILAGIPIVSNLTLWDAENSCPISYDPDLGGFGGLLLGSGYSVNMEWNAAEVDGHTRIQYDGAPDGLSTDQGTTGTDMWISLPGVSGMTDGGIHWVGMPFNHNVEWTTVKVTDGTETIDVMDAVGRGWLEGFWPYWDGVNQSPLNIDLDLQPNMEPGKVYMVTTHRNNLALIIPCGENFAQ